MKRYNYFIVVGMLPFKSLVTFFSLGFIVLHSNTCPNIFAFFAKKQHLSGWSLKFVLYNLRKSSESKSKILYSV